MDGGKRYPDLRYLFIRGLIDWEIHQRSHHFLKSASEWTSKAIVSLDLSEEPVKSIKQASQLDGVGKEISKKFRDIQTSILYAKEPPTPGKFVSSAPAILVTLLIAKQQMIMNQDISPDKCYIQEEAIKTLAPTMCEERFQHINTDEEVFCPAMWRLNVMCTKGYIKKRSVNKKAVYELLPPGERIAQRLKDKQFQVNSIPKITENINAGTNPLEDALYTNDTGSDGLVLLVDIKEWGGDRVGLGELTRMIERYDIRYKTSSLKCGDYSWIWRCGEDQLVLPVLIERKRADDLARSLKDGRYISQKERMIQWKSCFENNGISCTLMYLIEGQPEQYVVKCLDRCGAVVKCGFPTVKQLQGKIQEIDNDVNFELVQTDNISATVQYLDSVNMELQRRLNQGDFDELLNKHVNPNVDFDKPKKNQNSDAATLSIGDRPVSLKDTAADNRREEYTDVIILDDSDSQNDKNEFYQAKLSHNTQISTGIDISDHASEESESQEMIGVHLGQYHCFNEMKKKVPNESKAQTETTKCISPEQIGNLPLVRANISSTNKNSAQKHGSLMCSKYNKNASFGDQKQEMFIPKPKSKILFDLFENDNDQDSLIMYNNDKTQQSGRKTTDFKTSFCFQNSNLSNLKDDYIDRDTAARSSLNNMSFLNQPSCSYAVDKEYNILSRKRTAGKFKSMSSGSGDEDIIFGSDQSEEDEQCSIKKNPRLNLPEKVYSETRTMASVSSPTSGKVYRMKKVKKTEYTKVNQKENKSKYDVERTFANDYSSIGDDSELPDLDSDYYNPSQTIIDVERSEMSDKEHLIKTEIIGVKCLKKDEPSHTENVPSQKTNCDGSILTEKYRKQIEQIMAIVPEVNLDHLKTLLELYGGNVDLVVSTLFDEVDP